MSDNYISHERCMDDLIGAHVGSIWVSRGEDMLVIQGSGGPYVYQAQGDCCSESWFADITGVSTFKGSVVQSVEELPLAGYDVNDGRSRQDSDQVYGYRIKTLHGALDVIFRNSSNGYYGGWLSRVEGYEPNTGEMVEITEDWRA